MRYLKLMDTIVCILCGNSISTCLSIYIFPFFYHLNIDMHAIQSYHALLYASIHTCCCYWCWYHWCSAYYSCISVNMLTYGISTMTHLYTDLHTHIHMHLTHLIFVLSYFLLRSLVRFVFFSSPFILNILFAFKFTIPKLSTLEKKFWNERERKKCLLFSNDKMNANKF